MHMNVLSYGSPCCYWSRCSKYWTPIIDTFELLVYI